MHQKFEEVGVDVAGGTYGHFTGEAEWDGHGQVVAIELETSGSDGKPLTLNIEDLVRERIELRRQHGTAFLEETDGRDAACPEVVSVPGALRRPPRRFRRGCRG